MVRVRVPSSASRVLKRVIACGLVTFAVSHHSLAADASQTDKLKRLSLEDLGNVEVTSVSKEPEELWQTAAAVYVLTRDDIRRSGALTLPDLLRTVPGVEVAELEGNIWAVGIRGFNSPYSKDVLVLIDGRSVYTPLFEGVYWDAQDVLLDDIDRIEIIRGPGGSIWGANAVNGVINIITRHAKDTQGTLANGSSGYVDRFNGSVREGLHRGDNFQYRLFAKGFVREDERNPHYGAYDKWHLAHGGIRADWAPTPNDFVTAEADGYTGASGQQVSYASYVPLAQLVVNDTFSISGGDFVLDWQHRYSGGSDFHAKAYFDRTSRQGLEFGETRNTVDLDFIDHLTMLPGQDFIWGVGARLSPGNVVQTQATVDFEPHAQTDYVYSAFLQDAFRLLPQSLTLTLGSKFEYNNYTGFEIEPSGRILWNPLPHAALWAAMSRAVRTPGRLDRDLQLTDVELVSPAVLARVDGDPSFKSEVMVSVEAGYRQLLARALYVDIAAFRNDYENLECYGARTVSFITTPVTAELITIPYANGIKGTTDGLEIAPDWRPTRWWELKGNFSHVHIGVRPMPGYNDTATVASDEGSSPHRTATLQSLLNLPHGGEFDFDYRFVSRLPTEKIPSYQTMDSHVSWLFGKSVRLTVAGRNLLQPHHQEFVGDANLPTGIRRSVYGGITWTE
jgi:iron complex outermembrane recepter protein